MPEDHLQALPDGCRIDEYEIVRVLGAGGFGITYRAFDHNLQAPVAIKEYLDEARLLARLDHPNVVRVRRCIEAHNTGYTEPVLIDFGSARRAAGEKTRHLTEHVCGFDAAAAGAWTRGSRIPSSTAARSVRVE